jgi:glycosyltransferase involved in cell wall biosynthesis
MKNCLTANTPFGDAPIVPLSIQPDNWPTHYHIGDKLRMVSLTNADYMAKVVPIVDQINTVNEWCDRNNGHWYICGDGEHADLIERATDGREHVFYTGYVDAQDWLNRADVMLHFSTMDIQAPNAVLEGMASQIPVVTSENNIFQNLPSPAVTGRDIASELDRLQDPMHRKAIVDQQQSYLQANHTPAVVGKQIASVL